MYTINLHQDLIARCTYHGKVLYDSILALVPSMMGFYLDQENCLQLVEG